MFLLSRPLFFKCLILIEPLIFCPQCCSGRRCGLLLLLELQQSCNRRWVNSRFDPQSTVLLQLVCCVQARPDCLPAARPKSARTLLSRTPRGGSATSWTTTRSTSCWCAWCAASCSTPTAWRQWGATLTRPTRTPWPWRRRRNSESWRPGTSRCRSESSSSSASCSSSSSSSEEPPGIQCNRIEDLGSFA